MSDRFSLTDDQIRQWERDKEALEGEIAERQRKLTEINERLKAVAILRAALEPSEAPARPEPRERSPRFRPPTNGHRQAESSGNLFAAIERIATTSPVPLTKKEIKERLAAEHFPEERLGPYFYTCIMRLKDKERIKVLDDGRVWKP